jgi:hypothetical protein
MTGDEYALSHVDNEGVAKSQSLKVSKKTEAQ